MNSDFTVKYRFRTSQEGGRKTPVAQGYRSDFWYYHDENNENLLYMIWPIFRDENGVIIRDAEIIRNEGIAGMRIVSDQWVKYHKSRIKIGTKGYFMEGAIRVAECEVIELGNRLKE